MTLKLLSIESSAEYSTNTDKVRKKLLDVNEVFHCLTENNNEDEVGKEKKVIKRRSLRLIEKARKDVKGSNRAN